VKVALPVEFKPQLENLPTAVGGMWYESGSEAAAAVRDGADVLWAAGVGTELQDAIAASSDLRWVHTHGAGTESHPLALYRRCGLIFTNGSGIGAVPISEYAVMMMLAAAKRLPELVRAQDRGEWLKVGPGNGELFGARALIVGLGEIGRAIGARLSPFGVDVVGVRRRPGGEPNVIGVEEWRARLGEFDWVILSTILTGETRHMISSGELAKMKPTAWLANISRGGLVDQAALTSALASHAIGGAYLDVTDPEPLPADSELWRLPNVILSPHSSWTSSRFARRSADLFLANLDRYQSGEPLRNVVDLEVGYRVT
jgi:phosphoglycerate dehydrogenase-like enzyme